MLMSIFYVSDIAEDVSDLDVEIILGVAQVKNRRLDVTGMLAVGDGHFAQILEGRIDVVSLLFERIQADRRHASVRVLSQESIVTRRFARWSMRLVNITDLSDELRLLHRKGINCGERVRHLVQVLMPEPHKFGQSSACYEDGIRSRRSTDSRL